MAGLLEGPDGPFIDETKANPPITITATTTNDAVTCPIAVL